MYNIRYYSIRCRHKCTEDKNCIFKPADASSIKRDRQPTPVHVDNNVCKQNRYKTYQSVAPHMQIQFKHVTRSSTFSSPFPSTDNNVCLLHLLTAYLVWYISMIFCCCKIKNNRIPNGTKSIFQWLLCRRGGSDSLRSCFVASMFCFQL